MTDAYHAGRALKAEAALLALGTGLDRTHPEVSANLCEGLDETLTVLRRTLRPRWRRHCEREAPNLSDPPGTLALVSAARCSPHRRGGSTELGHPPPYHRQAFAQV
jgi:hypothetical protein